MLAKEPVLFPDSLFSLDADAAPWCVVQVRSRCEKALARHLRAERVPFYLPQQRKVIHPGGRRRVSHLPLFPGYVFLRGGRQERLSALRSRRVAHLIEVFDQCLLDRELCQLRALEEAGFLLVALPYLEPGDPVEILEGAFRGHRGIVRDVRGRERLLVAVTCLQRSVSVEVGRDSLRELPIASPGERRIRVA